MPSFLYTRRAPSPYTCPPSLLRGAQEVREQLEDESGPKMPSAAKPTEALLLAEFAHDAFAKALLLTEMAPYRESVEERNELLMQAHHPPPTTSAAHCPPPTTHRPPPTAHSPPPTTPAPDAAAHHPPPLNAHPYLCPCPYPYPYPQPATLTPTPTPALLPAGGRAAALDGIARD